MRRIIILIMVCLLFLAAGCGDARYHLTVNRDGSGDIDLRVALDNLTLDLLGQAGADPLAALKGVLEADGYTVTSIRGANQRGVIARKHVPKLTPQGMGLARLPAAPAAAATSPGIQVQPGFFRNRYRFEAEIDPAAFAPVRELDGLEAFLLARMDYELALTLPVPASEHNADSARDGGKTLIWQLAPGQAKEVLVEADQWNPLGFACTVLLLGALGAGAYWYLHRQKKERPQG
jgi:hypothetical protein